MQEPKGQPRRQQPEPRPLGPLGLGRQHTQPKSRSFSAHFRPSLTAPFSKQAPLVGVHMGLWPVITGGKSAAFMEGGQMQVLGSFLVTQCPTCQIAALYTHWCRMRKGLTSTALSQRKSLPDPDISPSQASHLATCDPERELTPCTARGK